MRGSVYCGWCTAPSPGWGRSRRPGCPGLGSRSRISHGPPCREGGLGSGRKSRALRRRFGLFFHLFGALDPLITLRVCHLLLTQADALEQTVGHVFQRLWSLVLQKKLDAVSELGGHVHTVLPFNEILCLLVSVTHARRSNDGGEPEQLGDGVLCVVLYPGYLVDCSVAFQRIDLYRASRGRVWRRSG